MNKKCVKNQKSCDRGDELIEEFMNDRKNTAQRILLTTGGNLHVPQVYPWSLIGFYCVKVGMMLVSAESAIKDNLWAFFSVFFKMTKVVKPTRAELGPSDCLLATRR